MTSKIIFKNIRFINIDTKNFDRYIIKKGLFVDIQFKEDGTLSSGKEPRLIEEKIPSVNHAAGT